MKTLLKITIFITLLVIFQNASSGAGFEEVWSKPFMHEDIENFTDLVLQDNQSFLLINEILAHSFYKGVRIKKLLLSDLPKDVTEYNQSPGGPPSWSIPLWNMVYESGDALPHIDVSLVLQDRLVKIHSTIHAPDWAGFSHQFNLEGEYLGRFPNFNQVEAQYLQEQGIVPITMNGQPIKFPLTIKNVTYTSSVRLETTLILDSRNNITGIGNIVSVGIQDLITNGERASFHSLQIRAGNPEILPVKNNYFLFDRNLFLANPQEDIHPIPIQQKPDPPFASWSYTEGDKFYQVEILDSVVVFLTQYRITGIPGLSAVEENLWDGLR